MSAPSPNDSVSPASRSPLPSPSDLSKPRPSFLRASSSPGPYASYASFSSTSHPVPAAELQLPIPTPGSSTLGSVESPDYLNGGLPHGSLSPVSRHHRSPSDVPSTPRGLSPVRVPGPDNATIPSEPGTPGRVVQFAQNSTVLDVPPNHSRHGSWDDGEAGNRTRGERWISKLKSSLGSSTSIQAPPKSPASSDLNLPSSSNSPIASRANRLPETLEEEEGSDADVEDVEESGDEAPGEATSSKPKKRKRMKRRLKQLDLRPNPTTTRTTDDTQSPRVARLSRRSTMPDPHEQQRGGFSEDEGRAQLAGRRRGWARGASWVGAGRHEETNGDEGAVTPLRGPGGHRRRISDMFTQGGGGASDGEFLSAQKRRGGQKWRQVKKTLKIFGGKKKIDQFDYYKSAELMAELRAITPAVVIFASMLQRDERGNRRIPVLLEQLNLRVVDSYPGEKGASDRHSVFKIALEYGSGVSRMSWTVTRSIWEIYQLHLRYKVTQKADITAQSSKTQHKRPKQPTFPKRLLKILGYNRKLDSSSEDEKNPETPSQQEPTSQRLGSQSEPPSQDMLAEGTAGERTNAEATASDTERRPGNYRKKSRINNFLMRRQSSGLEGADAAASAVQSLHATRKRHIEKQRRWMEKYLQEMIHWLMFRADSARLCHFLELSALGVRLAAEGSFHGKECFLHIQSSKGLDFRRVLTPQKVVQRHSRKWFLVRQNYIAVVESPGTMNIYDVYLVDPTFKIVSKKSKLKRLGAKTKRDKDGDLHESVEEAGGSGHHTMKLYTSERKIKLFSRNQTLIRQFEESVVDMMKQTEWHQRHRFNSFAPVRQNAFAQWLVDARDYMWNVSRAINMAQDVIYIHDWWLSPELYLRRPACISQKWRLDRLLQKKARQGVKIFVILYRNVEQAIPIDSEYTKFSLLNLHDNIAVLRSPNQFKKNQFFYAHHEKICIVDHDLAFLGGVDLCFGRWDNPQHPLADDRPTGMEDGDSPRDADNCQLFPGKDYSNPRVLDFFQLNEPYEEMYDRSRTPRMPWHDVGMQVVGQPARDLTRHFVQRWNYLRRERKPTRPTPFLLPPPDANPADLEALGLSGTCEVQMLRSAGEWSLGLSHDHIEHSIQETYLKLIEESEHFVYMENQFFITSCETLSTRVNNRIGDALVERIMRADENEEDWRCCILIPLMPGFQNTVDQAEGSSVRLIMQFQYRSICRGPTSIFGRLRAANINPHQYIRFFSLRQWDHIGSNNNLVTEQLYIHAKTIIVDDRVALIGSANINERSMLGNRDSECAAVVRDTEMLSSKMAGKPFMVGRFAHTLRMRLMREHLGLDVDQITEEERNAEMGGDDYFEEDMARIYDDADYQNKDHPPIDDPQNAAVTDNLQRPAAHNTMSYNHDATDMDPPSRPSSRSSSASSGNPRSGSFEGDSRVQGNEQHTDDLEGLGPDHWKAAQAKGVDLGSDSAIIGGEEVLLHRQGQAEKHAAKTKSRTPQSTDHTSTQDQTSLPLPPDIKRRTTAQLGLTPTNQVPSLPVSDDTDIGGPNATGRPGSEKLTPFAAAIQQVKIDKDCMRDPVCPEFWDDTWCKLADNNTNIYRRVFRCMPDTTVNNWKDYHQFEDYRKAFTESMSGQKNEEHDAKSQISNGGAPIPGVTVPATPPQAANAQEKTPAAADDNPQVTVSNEHGEQFSEKTPVAHEDHRDSRTHEEMSAEKHKDTSQEPPSPVHPAGEVPFPAFEDQTDAHAASNGHPEGHAGRNKRATFSDVMPSAEGQTSSSTISPGAADGQANGTHNTSHTTRPRRATTRGSRRGGLSPFDMLTREEAEEMCNLIQGHLVTFPYDWLDAEEHENHWLYQADLLAPKEIYN